LSVVSVVCLSGRDLCDGPITRPEESCRLWCVTVCDLETSRMRRLKPASGLQKLVEENQNRMRVWLYVIFTTYGCPPLSLNPVIRATRGVHLIVPVRVDVSLLNRGPLKCLPSCVPSSPQAASATRTTSSSPHLFDQWSASQSASSQFTQLLKGVQYRS
jgi:hypothetical protein